MTWDQIKENWETNKPKVKSRWPKLDDEDLKAIEGHEERLIDKVQAKYNLPKDKAQAEVAKFCENC